MPRSTCLRVGRDHRSIPKSVDAHDSLPLSLSLSLSPSLSLSTWGLSPPRPRPPLKPRPATDNYDEDDKVSYTNHAQDEIKSRFLKL